MSKAEYRVNVQTAAARAIAAVRVRMRVERVSAEFGRHLDKIYAAARAGQVKLDGQNIFVYRGLPSGEADVEFGVGTTVPFAALGDVVPSETPSGTVATTVHWGDYAGLGAAHRAVIDWCREQKRALTSVRWEVYGHWSDDPAKRRTDVYWLLAG